MFIIYIIYYLCIIYVFMFILLYYCKNKSELTVKALTGVWSRF